MLEHRVAHVLEEGMGNKNLDDNIGDKKLEIGTKLGTNSNFKLRSRKMKAVSGTIPIIEDCHAGNVRQCSLKQKNEEVG